MVKQPGIAEDSGDAAADEVIDVGSKHWKQGRTSRSQAQLARTCASSGMLDETASPTPRTIRPLILLHIKSPDDIFTLLSFSPIWTSRASYQSPGIEWHACLS
ncbi:hypothetical protein C1H76_3829 [Elsinoe australis]|uniref:Uncharacterized protein n=1 Tax=Elsinoe australis TaxID=40998 RepID=A0A4U7B3B0_9PEZI|nr:hypothetical protein C1H76_3829 [Elsinoe australis]